MESARPATQDDLGSLCQLAEEAIDELQPTRGGAVWARYQARERPVVGSITAAVVDPDAHVVAGCIDDEVVGYAVVRLDRLRDGGLLAVLDDIFVHPDARGVGVGAALMDAVIEWATERGCIGIDSVALPGNRATKNFFESYGLVARAIVVHRSLTTDDPLLAEADPQE